jgi:hypothetical protein
MPRYYFDTCDGGDFIRDAIGLELDGIEAARDEAAPGLADFADRISGRDSPGSSRSSFRLPGRLRLRGQYNQLIIVTTQARNHMRKALAT